MKPDLKTYLDVSQYLQDIYKYRKQHRSDFSYETWASELGIKNKSYLRFVTLGRRRISESLTLQFIKNLELNEAERDYFEVLVAYCQAKDAVEKRLLGKKIIELSQKPLTQTSIDAHYALLADPVMMKLRTLLTFTDIQKDSARLAQILMVPLKKIEECLSTLNSLDLINTDQSAKQEATKIPDHFKDLGLQTFYKNTFQEAAQALALPATERRFRSSFFAMNASEFLDFQAKVNEFVLSQLQTYNFDQLDDRRLFHFNLSVFPVTQAEVQNPPAEDQFEKK
ncbi:MAG: TIGR02147 family protein [Bdellovibrio sp.]|nr:TIGR02147 family protein [Bdellovibrio sp.]